MANYLRWTPEEIRKRFETDILTDLEILKIDVEEGKHRLRPTVESATQLSPQDREFEELKLELVGEAFDSRTSFTEESSRTIEEIEQLDTEQLKERIRLQRWRGNPAEAIALYLNAKEKNIF